MKNFPVPNIDEFLQEAKRFNFFFPWISTVNTFTLSQKVTAFITRDELYEFKRLSFGLKNASAVSASW